MDAQSSVSLKGMGWSLAGRMLIKVIQFCFSIFLSRLLCPADFGLVGMVMVVMSLGSVLMDGGLVAALIRKGDQTEEDYATVIWSKLAVALFLYAVLFLCAPLVAEFYGRADLTDVMRVVLLGLPFGAITSPLAARLQINARFRDSAFVSAAAVFLSGIVGVVLASQGYGVWAVVVQGLAWHVVILLLLMVVNRWMPKVCFSMASFRSLFDFGWKHLIRSVVETIYANSHAVVIGKMFGAADLGIFNRANYYTSEIGLIISGTVNDVNYPLLSRLQEDDVQLHQSYRRLQMLVAGVMFFGMAIFSALAEWLIRIVIGIQWLPCVLYLRILSVGAAFSPLVTLAFTMMYVKGRSDLALRLTLIEKATAFVLLLVALPFGISAICVTISVSAAVTFCINEYVVCRNLRGTCAKGH